MMSKDQSRNMRKQKENTAKTLMSMREQAKNAYHTCEYCGAYTNRPDYDCYKRSESAIIEEKHRQNRL